MKIKKGDRLRHNETDEEGTAQEDEKDGRVSVKQDDDAVTIWAVGDATVLS